MKEPVSKLVPDFIAMLPFRSDVVDLTKINQGVKWSQGESGRRYNTLHCTKERSFVVGEWVRVRQPSHIFNGQFKFFLFTCIMQVRKGSVRVEEYMVE